MKALVYGVPPEPYAIPDGANTLTKNLARTPTALREVPDPQLLHRDWVTAYRLGADFFDRKLAEPAK